MHIKRTWEVCTDKDIEKIYNKVWDYVSLNFDLDECPDLYLNKSNSTHNLGLYCNGTFNHPIIVLNKLFINHKDRVLNTILHEFAHHIAYVKYGPKTYHNYRWQRIADELGRKFGEKITHYCPDNHEVLIDARDRKQHRSLVKKSIKVICSKCQHEFQYKREMRWFKGKDSIDLDGGYCPYCKGNHFIVKRYQCE